MDDNEEQQKQPTLWHYLLGRLLEKLLSSVNVLVYSELSVMSQPPKADILLLRREGSFWTDEQRKRLPDSVRDSQASHILLEFKYTESLDEKAFQQALCYKMFYQQTQKLANEDVQAFVISSKTPQKKRLEGWDYAVTEQVGVYRSEQWLLTDIPLLILNELSPTPHNAWIKCFASRQKEQQNAFEVLQETDLITKDLAWFLNFLRYVMKEVSDMKATDTEADFKQQLFDLENRFQKWYLSKQSIPYRLAGLKPEEVVSYFEPKDVLSQFNIDELEAHLTQLKQQKKRKRQKKT